MAATSRPRPTGAGWESRGLRVLAASAAAFAALFPLAAGLLPAGTAGAGTAAGAGSTGVLGALGGKTATAIAGTAVVGAAAGGAGVYQASTTQERPAVVRATKPRPASRCASGRSRSAPRPAGRRTR